MNVNQKFKVKEFEWFQMQTKVRQMVQQIVGPLQKRILQHSTNITKIKQQQNIETNKVQQLTLMVTNDPKVFEFGVFKEVDKKFQVHEKALEEVRRLIQQENNFVEKKFSLLDIRMKESNEVMLNFASLKERLHKQIEMQNQNIDKIRGNLEKMIGQIGGQIKRTNDQIVDNKLASEKADNCLSQRLRNLQAQLEITQQGIRNNKALIMEKNIILENHEYKLQNHLQRINGLEDGILKVKKLQQFVKDMEISIKKAEFRVDAITPLVTMAQVSEALEYILPQKMKKRVTIFGYKKYSKYNRQILDKSYDNVSEKFSGIELVEQMQKRNTRQITQMKRKKIISMGIDIDHLTFEARQRYYQQVDMDQLSQDEQDNQNNAKIDEAQILNLVSLYFNQFTTDVSEKVKNQLEDTKEYLYGMESQIRKQMQMNETQIKKLSEHCNTFHRDQMLEMKAVQNQTKQVKSKQQEVLRWLQRGQQIERKFYNFCSLVNHLQIQDQIDKQNMSLMGIQQHRTDPLEKQGKLPKQRNSIVQIQKNCFSCCGYPASVLSSFKMACLAYQPSQIVIDAKQYRRQDILEFTTNILQTIRTNIQQTSNNIIQQLNFNRSIEDKLQNSPNNQATFQTVDKDKSTLQNQLFKYLSPQMKSRFQLNTTTGNPESFNANETLKSPEKGQRKTSSIRLRKSMRKNTQTNLSNTVEHKTRNYLSHLKSQSLSKDMALASNAFVDLKKRHMSYLN